MDRQDRANAPGGKRDLEEQQDDVAKRARAEGVGNSAETPGPAEQVQASFAPVPASAP